MNQLSGKVLKTVLFCFFILFCMNGCKDDYNSVIPDVYVNLDINPVNFNGHSCYLNIGANG